MVRALRFMGPGLGWERLGLQGKESTEGGKCSRTDFQMGLKSGICLRAGFTTGIWPRVGLGELFIWR